MQENKFKALVLDSGAFINHASIVNAAEVRFLKMSLFHRNTIQSKK